MKNWNMEFQKLKNQKLKNQKMKNQNLESHIFQKGELKNEKSKIVK